MATLRKSRNLHNLIFGAVFVFLLGFTLFVTVSSLRQTQVFQPKAAGCSNYNQSCANNPCCTNLKCVTYSADSTRLCKNTINYCPTWCRGKTLQYGSTNSNTGGRCQISNGTIIGGCVTYLQRRLNAKNCNSGTADGIFGSITKAAVIWFQRSAKIYPSGVVGSGTWSKLATSQTCNPDLRSVGGTIPLSGCNQYARAFATAVIQKFPTAQYAGCYACRRQRGSTANTDCWSEHAWGNAVDFFGPVYKIRDWANTADVKKKYNINASFYESSPGDVHTQFNPRHSCYSTPPCAQ